MNASGPYSSVFPFVLCVRFFVSVAVLCLSCITAFAQATPASGDYTTSLPSVQRVQAEIKGSDQTDTVARQVAVFRQLVQYIDTIKYQRTVRGPYTSSEAKLHDAYQLAAYQITQDYAKSHTPDEIKAFDQLWGRYLFDEALYKDYHRLIGQQAVDTYKGAEVALAQSYQRNQDRIQQGLNHPQGGTSNSELSDALEALNDTPEARRCLELSGSWNECAGSSLKGLGKIAEVAAARAIGVDPNAGRALNGVVLVGSYRSRTDLPEVVLTWDGMAILQKCGTLVDENHRYTLRKSRATTQIIVDNEPNPIVLTSRSDGSLSGPGNIPVKGNIISGYHNQYNCPAGTSHFNCTTSSIPIYSPSMQRCTVGQLAAKPAPTPPPKATGLTGQISEMIGSGDAIATIYGFRVIGSYASSTGMLLTFNNRYVTLDCGHAHVNAPYIVDNTATGFVIHVQNAGGAFLLAVAPDNTLRGSGSASVNGRLVTAMHGENVSFTPHSQSCNVSTFVPKGSQNTMLASNAPMPGLPADSSSAAPAPIALAATPGVAATSVPIGAALASTGISPQTGGARAQFRVLLSSSFSGPNPLAGQAVFVTRKPMDQILRELGVAVPANATPGQAMKVLQTQCHSAQGCSSIIQGMSKYYVSTMKLDVSGKATLSATAITGPYYFFAIVPVSGGSLVWDVPANLAAGDNIVAFNQSNAEHLQ